MNKETLLALHDWVTYVTNFLGGIHEGDLRTPDLHKKANRLKHLLSVEIEASDVVIPEP